MMASMTAQDAEAEVVAMVARLLEALQRNDAPAYHALLTDDDQEILDLAAIEQNMAAMRTDMGRLVSFKVEGVVLYLGVNAASANVTLDFENAGTKSELYSLERDESGWRLDLGLAHHE